MKVIAINGGARKNGNTSILLQKALEGAKSKGAETELVNLYDLDFKGCIGCLGCKLKGGDVGRCVIRDVLRPIFDAIHNEYDAVIFGSPIYLGEVTGELRSFLERLLFQYISYDKDRTPLFKREIKTGFIFTTNCPEAHYEMVGYIKLFEDYKGMIGRTFNGECRTLAVSETWQTDNYDKYHMSMFDVPAKKKRREEVFPVDCQNAFELGEWLV